MLFPTKINIPSHSVSAPPSPAKHAAAEFLEESSQSSIPVGFCILCWCSKLGSVGRSVGYLHFLYLYFLRPLVKLFMQPSLICHHRPWHWMNNHFSSLKITRPIIILIISIAIL